MRKHAGHGILRLVLCAVLFAAALVGAVVCGIRMDTARDAAHEAHLRRLIYLHFFLSQLIILAVAALIWTAHRRRRRSFLIVSYNEHGMMLNPPGVLLPHRRIFRCNLRHLSEAKFPPPDAPISVYPMFMLSGKSSGRRLEQLLRRAYAGVPSPPELYIQPVFGASPWLAQAAARYIRPLLTSHSGILVVAHGSALAEPPPEPALFCRRLRELLPNTEIKPGYFGQLPDAREVLRGMHARHVLLLPFLLTNGVHARRDLPTQQDARAVGKSLRLLPVAAELLYRENHDETSC